MFQLDSLLFLLRLESSLYIVSTNSFLECGLQNIASLFSSSQQGFFAEQKFLILMSFNLLVFPFMDHNIGVNLRILCLDPKDFPPFIKDL